MRVPFALVGQYNDARQHNLCVFKNVLPSKHIWFLGSCGSVRFWFPIGSRNKAISFLTSKIERFEWEVLLTF